MKKLVTVLLFLAIPSIAYAQQGNQVIPTGSGSGGGLAFVASLPATCTPGVTASVELSVPPYAIYYCSATNVWSASGTTPVSNTTLVTAPNPTINTDTKLMELTLPAQYLNTSGQPYLIQGNGTYNTTAAAVPALTYKIKLSTGAACTGTCITLANIVTGPVNTAQQTGLRWGLQATAINNATGATGNLLVQGAGLLINIGATSGSPATSYPDTNTGVSSNIDLTASLFLSFWVAQSVAGASNSYIQTGAMVSPANAGVANTGLPAGVTSPGAGALTGTGLLNFAGLAEPFNSLALSNGTNENLSCANTSQYITGPTTAFSIGGFVARPDGQFCILYNTTSQTMTINNLDAGSSAANQIKTLTGANVSVSGPGTVTLMYSTTDALWHIHDPWPPPGSVSTLLGSFITGNLIVSQCPGPYGTAPCPSGAQATDSGISLNGPNAVGYNVCGQLCDQLSQTGPVGPSTVYTTGIYSNATLFRYDFSLVCRSGSGTVSVGVYYVDETGTLQIANAIQPLTCGTNVISQGSWIASPGSNQPLQYFTLTNGTVNYNVHVRVTRLG
jgi:hypothetical protein